MPPGSAWKRPSKNASSSSPPRPCDARLDAEWLDLTLPAPGPRRGHLHPITRIQRELEELFASLGFAVLDGPEVETEYHNFDALNIPPDHPARDMQDTFWLDGGNLLRTHTSPVQVRGMERLGPPLRMIAPGRVFRNESVDASHEHTFYQLEGMMVDRDVSVAHLLYFMKTLLTAIFQREVTVRLRPGYFPFVEPGFELDIQCLICGGPGCPVCKQSGWVELLPCGLVQSQRAAHERHRPRRVERLRLRPGPHAPGHDALRHRRHPPLAGRRPAIPGAVLRRTLKFSYNWIRELVEDLDYAPGPLERLITMKTAECEGIEAVGGLLAERLRRARAESVEPIAGSHNVKAVVDTGRYGREDRGLRRAQLPRRAGHRLRAHRQESHPRRRKRRHAGQRRRTGHQSDHAGILELDGASRRAHPWLPGPTASSRSTTSPSPTVPTCGAITAWRAKWPPSSAAS